ncbi:MAG: histidine kinase [Epulopiscium sp.]|nr:histidine kinase [Candidatus Epulonipiscium sp.]
MKYNFFHKMGIRSKLNIGYMTMMLVLVSVSFVMYIRINARQVERKMFKTDQQQVFLIKTTIESVIYRVDMISADIALNPSVQKALKEGRKEYYYISEREINEYLNNTINRDVDIASIYIIDKNNYIYYVDRDQKEARFPDDFLASLDTEELVSLKGRSKWNIQKNMFIQDDNNYMTVSRAINSIEDYQTIGYVVITVRNNVLEDIYKKFSSNDMYSYMIEDNKKQSIIFPYDGRAEEVKKTLSLIPYTVDEYYKKQIEKQTHYFIKVPLESIDWDLSCAFVYDNNFQSIELIFIFLILLYAILSIIGSRIINSVILKPLESISSSINKIRDGDLTTRFKITNSNDEINQLSAALNMMMDQINLLLEKLNKEHEIQRKLEFDLLVSQIKPHFLYNTLNAVSAYISIGKKEEAFYILRTLAAYYRLCLSSGKDIITIRDELELLKNYVDIMNIRMNKLFEVSYEIDDAVLDCTIPKLTLQPLVENSINHGIRDFEKALNIKCIIKKIEDKNLIFIAVEDDGVGIPEKIIIKILGAEEVNKTSGFGLRSIIQRLSIYYKVEDINEIIKIESIEGKYTKVYLYIPIKNS